MSSLADGARPKSVKFSRKTLAGEVADELRRRILAGEMLEGVQLMQEQLATEFGISKVPVREALFQLEAEGFVTQQYHRGAVVSGLSPAQVLEIFELRTQIEVWLLELGMAAATDADVQEAREAARTWAAADDPLVAWDLNWRLHEALYRPSRKPYAIEHVMKLHSQTARYVRTQYSVALDKAETDREHTQLIDLYARKDPQAKVVLRDHILTAATQLTSHLERLKSERGA